MKFLCGIMFLVILALSIGLSSKSYSQSTVYDAMKSIDLKSYCNRPYIPYPDYRDRNYWDNMPAPVKEWAIKSAENCLQFNWIPIPDSYYRSYYKGDTSEPIAYKNKNFVLQTLIFGELLEGKSRFLDAIAKGIISICEQKTWVARGSIKEQSGGIEVPDTIKPHLLELQASSIAETLALCYFFLKGPLDKYVSTDVCKLLKQQVRERVLDVFYSSDVKWMHLGIVPGLYTNYDNWVPTCSNAILPAILLLEDDPVRKYDMFIKTARLNDQFLRFYQLDGGCVEGTNYWQMAGGNFMKYIAKLKKITGSEIDFSSNKMMKNMGEYIVKMNIDSFSYVNFGDAVASLRINPLLPYAYGDYFDSDILKMFASYLARCMNFKTGFYAGGLTDRIELAINYGKINTTPDSVYRGLFSWFEGIEQIVCRERDGSVNGLLLAAKGGNNGTPHAHMDVGQFIIYKDGLPFIIDLGVGTYNYKTWDKERSGIWYISSASHNVPVVNGCFQGKGTRFSAENVIFSDDGVVANFVLDVSKAYPVEAFCRQWLREINFDRVAKTISMSDEFLLDKVSGVTSLTYLTPARVSLLRDGILCLENKGKNLTINYDSCLFNYSQEVISLTDTKQADIWGKQLTQISLIPKRQSQKGKLGIVFR